MVEIKSVAVLRFGTVCAVLYAFFGLLEALFLVPIMSLAPAGTPNAFPAGMRSVLGVGGFIFLPILFAIAGFIGGLIGALLYNLVARWTGGVKLRVEQTAGGMELQPLSS
jgi:hypothetical protein